MKINKEKLSLYSQFAEMNPIDNFYSITESLPAGVRLVVVSKTQPASLIQELHLKTGHVLFGENKVQELLSKRLIVAENIQWHLIGHLQTNKVRQILPYLAMIQSVDSLRLLSEINKEAAKADIVVPCLLQIHIAEEASKFGFSLPELQKLADSSVFESLQHIEIRGVMGMATFTTDHLQVRSEFKSLKRAFDNLRSGYFAGNKAFNEISMGMSDDYQIAIDEGSTIVRIGTGIFGSRNYL
jgi:hypothetical protein